ncbi:MAG: GNAT family N-acetyltransferase [Bacteroidia bacterium]
MFEIKKTEDEKTISDAKKLLVEYGDYMYNEINLIDGKSSFPIKLNTFPGNEYEEPHGVFLIAYANNWPAGCIGLRRFDSNSCEMKRLYVRPKFRGQQIGYKLCEKLIELAKCYGYQRMILDTNKEMSAAIKLYQRLFFMEIQPYCLNENPNPIYLQKIL